MAISTFPIPGDPDFPLNGMFAKPANNEVGQSFHLSGKVMSYEAFVHFLDKMKQYLEQLRKECSDRMVDRVIDPETDKPSKVISNSMCFFRL